jgi:hypothetical protein
MKQKIVILPCHKTDPRGGGRGVVGLGLGEGVELDGTGKISKITVSHASSHRHCWRSLNTVVTTSWVGVRWPIYRANLLVSAMLIQPIPIIICVSCIKTADTKNTDRKLGELFKFLVFSSTIDSKQNSPIFSFSLLLFTLLQFFVFTFQGDYFGVSNVFMAVS